MEDKIVSYYTELLMSVSTEKNMFVRKALHENAIEILVSVLKLDRKYIEGVIEKHKEKLKVKFLLDLI
jgi:hypothetical protein